MEWPYPGVPASVVADFAGHRVAELPFFAPETVTTDHGGPYKSHYADLRIMPTWRRELLVAAA
jgi:hypothetical protein